MVTVVGARFMKAGRMYFFDPGTVSDYRVNDWIIVRTELGVDAARVQILPTDSPLVQVDPPLGTVVRKASVADVLEINKRERMDADAALAAGDMARARRLPIKILGADWQFDGSALTIFFSIDPSGRGPADADLAELNAAFAAHFGTRVELRRMGARDETKVMTGVGTCGAGSTSSRTSRSAWQRNRTSR
ncbi:MAG: hypothetical protein E6I48_06520 [Chloroflexi bacterium]|nr:MAG: hypothetical protein E6I48_06520 [Chloroflexota bacterium]